MKRCMSGHNHGAEYARRICDQNLKVRMQVDREARPGSYRPIEPTIQPAPRWLERAGKDLTGNLRSN